MGYKKRMSYFMCLVFAGALLLGAIREDKNVVQEKTIVTEKEKAVNNISEDAGNEDILSKKK